MCSSNLGAEYGFVLTDENYYSREADIHFMSCSQFQAFEKCEAAEIAKLRGIWIPEETSDALFQGQYFHSYFESPEAFDAFCKAGFDKIFKVKETKTRGLEIVGKYAPFQRLDEMIKVVENDPLISKILAWPGENELPMVGLVGGIPWRMKMDKYCAATRRIIDYKTSANLRELYYNVKTKERQTLPLLPPLHPFPWRLPGLPLLLRSAPAADGPRQTGRPGDLRRWQPDGLHRRAGISPVHPGGTAPASGHGLPL